MDSGHRRHLLRHPHLINHPYDPSGHPRRQTQPLRRFLQHRSRLRSLPRRLDQRKNSHPTRRQTFRSYRYSHVSFWLHVSSGIPRDAEHMADDGFGLCLGIFPILHRGLAFHNLFSVIQRPFRKFFRQQTARINHVFPLPNISNIHQQQHEPLSSHRSSLSPIFTSFPHIKKTTIDR